MTDLSDYLKGGKKVKEAYKLMGELSIKKLTIQETMDLKLALDIMLTGVVLDLTNAGVLDSGKLLTLIKEKKQ